MNMPPSNHGRGHIHTFQGGNMKQFILTLILVTIFSQFNYAIGKQLSMRQLEPIDAGHYFKMPSDIVAFEDTIYITDNFKHKLLVYDLSSDLHFSKVIGQPGQGPGDLNLPIELSIWENMIAVKDQIGFSFFTFDGQFISKFRSFGPWVSFVYLKDEIFNINIKPNSSHLISVYSMEGKKIAKIGNKYLAVNWRVNNNLHQHLAEKILYAGKLLSDGEFVYYINMNFGNVIKFSVDGKVIKEGDISPNFGEMGKFIKTKNEERLKNGIKIINKSIPVYNIFKDAYIHKNKIYFFGHDIRTPERTPEINKYREVNDSYITVIDSNSFKLLERYKIQLNRADRIFSGAVKGNAEKPVILLVMSTEEGNVITELK
jgi:hypothetical protein